MDDTKKTFQNMTVIEAIEKLEELKQKIVDENYQEMIDEGFANIHVPFEALEALEIVLYYLNTQGENSDNDIDS